MTDLEKKDGLTNDQNIEDANKKLSLESNVTEKSDDQTISNDTKDNANTLHSMKPKSSEQHIPNPYIGGFPVNQNYVPNDGYLQNNGMPNNGFQQNSPYMPNTQYPQPQYYPQNPVHMQNPVHVQSGVMPPNGFNGVMPPNGFNGAMPPNISVGQPYPNTYSGSYTNTRTPAQNFPNIPYNPANFQPGAYPHSPAGYPANHTMNKKNDGNTYNGTDQFHKPKDDPFDDLKTSSFYNERYKNPGTGRLKGLIAPLLIVALLSSILGGAITGAWFQFFYQQAESETAQLASENGNETVRRVEIVDKTDSPITAIAEKAGPAVVGINVEYTYNDSFFGVQDGGGQGSGIIISSDGYILTNNHVVEAAANTGTSSSRFSNKGKITVILPNQKDKPFEATIIGTDSKTDIAVIKIEATGLTVAEIGDSDALKVGELAVAIGNPAGLEYMGSVTSGIISGLNRQVDTGDGKMLSLIQTDAAISPGNSGGALLNSKGQVIGVNSSKIGGTSFEGLGFAIPIKDAMNIANTLKKDGFVTRPQIGVSIDNSFTPEIAKANKVPEGVLVANVMVGSSADDAGIITGDIITKFNDVKIRSFDELEVQKNLHKPGDKVSMEVYRVPEGAKPDAGSYVKVEMTLGSTADQPQ